MSTIARRVAPVAVVLALLVVTPTPVPRVRRSSFRDSLAILRAEPRLLGYLAIVMAVGMSSDGSKAVTLLLFTEGPALARLEFQSAPGDVTTDEYVLNTGKMQQIALRIGLPKN